MKEVINLVMPKSKLHSYSCPNCSIYPNDNELGYKVKGVKYPKRYNERKGFNGSCDYWDWDEVHYCKKCKHEFYFTNGAY